MGGALSDLELFPYEHWMPDEDPTFYIPASMTLTESQRAQLHATGFQQGEPFILTIDGLLTKSVSKKFALRGMKSSFSIRKGSLQLFEESPGKFSLEFYYFADEAVILEIHLRAVDASSSKYIKLKQSELKWGPFKLNPSNQQTASNTTNCARFVSPTGDTSTTTSPTTNSTNIDTAHAEEKPAFSPSSPHSRSRADTTRSRSSTSPRSRSNTYSRHGYLIVDVTELEDDDEAECKPTDTKDDTDTKDTSTQKDSDDINVGAAVGTTVGAAPTSVAYSTNINNNTLTVPVSTDTVQYTQWSSRKFQHKHLASPLPHITPLHLPSLGTPASTPVLTTGVYDVVLIVTTAEHVASATNTNTTTVSGKRGIQVTHNTNFVHNVSTHSTSPTTTAQNNTHTTTTTTNTNTTASANTYKTQASWLTRRTCQRVIPVRTNSLCGGIDNVVQNNPNTTNAITDTTKNKANTTTTTNTNNNTNTIYTTSTRPYSSVPAIDLSENPHSEAYQIANSEPDIDTLHNATHNTTHNTTNRTAITSTARTVAPHKQTHHNTRTNSTNSVQREAFFYRVNTDSYNKRHTTNTSLSAPVKAGASSKVTQTMNAADGKKSGVGVSNSISSASGDGVVYTIGSSSSDTITNTNTYTTSFKPAAINSSGTSSGIYMRSKGVTLDLSMQLFQVPTGVYNRITLYGMEGFFAPSGVNNVNSVISNSSDSSDSADINSNAQSKSHTNTNANTNANTNTNSNSTDADAGADCIICLSNKQTTIMFPCRHLCLCAECAATVATRANVSTNMNAAQRESAQEKKCPVCRKPVIVMFQLKP